jgi:hypothetical protein
VALAGALVAVLRLPGEGAAAGRQPLGTLTAAA